MFFCLYRDDFYKSDNMQIALQALGQGPLYPTNISLGCMSFHTLAQAKPIVATALELGINCFDTADLYDKGENERIVGQLLAECRQEVIIATKVGNRWRPDGSGWDWVPRKEYILEAVPRSLWRLKTDYIDLLQLHGGTIDDPLEEVVEAFELLRDRGHIRAYGISSIRPNTIRHWTNLASQASSCMSQYSLLDRRPEEEILDQLHEHQQNCIVRGALAKGLLAGKPAKAYLSHAEAIVTDGQKELASIAQQLGLPRQSGMAALALAYVLQHPAVATVALGASRASQLREVVAAWQQLDWKEGHASLLEACFPAKQYQAHR